MFFADLSRFRFILLDPSSRRLSDPHYGRGRNGRAKRDGDGFRYSSCLHPSGKCSFALLGDEAKFAVANGLRILLADGAQGEVRTPLWKQGKRENLPWFGERWLQSSVALTPPAFALQATARQPSLRIAIRSEGWR